MIRRQGYKFCIEPNLQKRSDLVRAVECSRFVWNEVLLMNRLREERGERRLRYPAMAGYLRYLKEENPFLREVHSQPLQQTLIDLERAYRRSSNPNLNARSPRLKRTGDPIGIRFPQDFKINGQALYLPKIGWIRCRISREIEGKPKNVTISFDGSRWYAAIQTEQILAVFSTSAKGTVGIDLGVVRFAALSDGSFIQPVNAREANAKRIASLKRQLSRKQKFSANWRKTKRKLSKILRKVTRIRNDMLHKASTSITRKYSIVAIEDLRVKGMSASASGSVEQPGINVNAKRALNRGILDQGWREFRRQLDYKLTWSGGTLMAVDPRYTSQTCAICGVVSQHSRCNERGFLCIACGHSADADTNAAVNILKRAGQARIACGDSITIGSVKQEAQFASSD